MVKKRNWFIISPLEKCEIHDKPFLYVCYKCMNFCASGLDCEHCRSQFKSWLPFINDVAELVVRYIAPKLSFYRGNCLKRKEFLEKFEIETEQKQNRNLN